MTTELEPTLGLPSPFPSSPKRPPKYVLKVENKQTGLFYITNFCELYPFKYLVSLILDDREWKWTSDKMITADDGITLTSDNLEQVVEYKLTPKERQWVPPSPYYGQWHNIAAGKQPLEKRQRPATAASEKTEDEPKRTSKKRATADPQQPERPPKRPRASRDGLTDLASIAAELKLEPKTCRVALRKSNTPKPDAGWAWPGNEVETIKAVILKHAK